METKIHKHLGFPDFEIYFISSGTHLNFVSMTTLAQMEIVVIAWVNEDHCSRVQVKLVNHFL